MPIIGNVNNAYSTNTKKLESKLSFEVDEEFSARITNVDELEDKVILKLLNGWEFEASLENLEDISPEVLAKFRVLGFKEGKLLLQLLENEDLKGKLSQENSIDVLLEKENVLLNKDQFSIVEKMIKYNIPLTKENMEDILNLIAISNKAKSGSAEIEDFINMYLKGKNISLDSDKGQQISNILKETFSNIKNINAQDILTLKENEIEPTLNNIKSFSKLFSQNSTKGIYSELKSIENVLSENENDTLKENIQISKSAENQIIGENIEIVDITNKELINNIKNLIKLQTPKSIEQIKQVVSQENKETLINIMDSLNEEEQEIFKELIPKENLNTSNENTDISPNDIVNKNINKPDNIQKFMQVKNEINNKTVEMKEIIKNIINNLSLDNNNQLCDKIIDILKNNINDFKMFNTISNEYYYADVPLSLNNNDYGCKLIIKDKRGKGKQIDSTNVKIATSISTNMMGVVDAYIKVNNKNMDISIKTFEPWIKVLNKGKDTLLKSLKDINYNVFIKVDEKKEDITLSNCKEFFNDNNFTTINVKA